MAHTAGVSGRRSKKIDPKRIGGIKRLRHLLPLLEPLHEVGCQRDKAANRRLHMDEYVTLVLLCLTNPLIDSMRALQQAGELDKISRQLGVRRFSLGSFSESVRVFDPEQLRQVIAQLADELNPLNADPRLRTHLNQALKIADGTVLDAIAKVARAAWLPFQDGSVKHAWRLHVQFDFDSFCPADVELTDARNSGRSNEKNVLGKKIQSDCCYVMDRGYGRFTLFNRINVESSSYVCRMKENSVFEVLEERLLSDEALEAAVVRDAVVQMGQSSRPQDRPDHPMRLVVIEAKPHAKRGGRKGKTAGPPVQDLIIIATNLLEAPAEIIALIYQYRWAIEIFFRFFKQILGCRHLLSQRPEGIMIQVYCAIIACMLINLWTGAKPTRRTVEMLAFYFMGVAGEEELMRHIAGLKKNHA